MGHLVRCAALAEALGRRGCDSVMVGPPSHLRQKAMPFREWLALEEREASLSEARALCEMARGQQANLIVLDDYRIEPAYQKVMRGSGAKLLAFGSSRSREQWVDWLLDASPDASPERYSGLMQQPQARLLLGPRYAVLRSPFRQVTPTAGHDVPRVLLTFGGGDDRGATRWVLEQLLALDEPDVTYVVVCGQQNPDNVAIARLARSAGRQRVEWHVDPSSVAPLYASCDLAIVAGGTTTYELACCGVPMLILTIAQNQVDQALAWERAGAAIALGSLDEWEPSRLVKAYAALRLAHERRRAMAKRGRALVDGLGADRVASTVLGGGVADDCR